MKNQLLNVLLNLAKTANEQIEYLQRLSVEPSADELALELDDVIPRVNLPMEVWEQVMSVCQKLEAMSGSENATLWEFDALIDSPDWEEVRQLANRALIALKTI